MKISRILFGYSLTVQQYILALRRKKYFDTLKKSSTNLKRFDPQ